MRLVEKPEQLELLEKFQGTTHDLKLVSGGSVANSIIAISQLGGTGAFIGCVSDDRYGKHYIDEFRELDIAFPNAPAATQTTAAGEATGTCLALITPDAERTLRTCLAVSSTLSADHVTEDEIAQSTWLFIEGYVFANPETGQHAIREAIQLAKKHNTKIALTCSDGFIPEVFGDAFREALVESDLLFCNAPESIATTQESDSESAFAKLKELVPNCVVTDGPNGAFIRFGDETCHVPAIACEPKDLTGAGDMFAGSFLYAITNGYSAEKAAVGANYMCNKVITQVGARLVADAKSLWSQSQA
ncbi:MAG: adenosine kinase [Planctomycetota bacterium]